MNLNPHPNEIEEPFPPEEAAAPDAGKARDDESTSLPGLTTWGRVYGFVTVVFIIYVVLLTMLSRAFF